MAFLVFFKKMFCRKLILHFKVLQNCNIFLSYLKVNVSTDTSVLIKTKKYNTSMDYMKKDITNIKFKLILRKKNIRIKEYFFDSNKWLRWMVTNKYFFRSKKYFYCL